MMQEEPKQQSQPAPQPRQPYAAPELTVHGTVEKMTEQVPRGGSSQQLESDRNIKEAFRSVDSADILAAVAALPITTWNYKDQERSIRHLGPMAQDFAAAFGVGEDDRHINMVDASGVALSAIQALYAVVREQGRQIAELESQVEAMRAETCLA